jgi:hypothetical protein
MNVGWYIRVYPPWFLFGYWFKLSTFSISSPFVGELMNVYAVITWALGYLPGYPGVFLLVTVLFKRNFLTPPTL